MCMTNICMFSAACNPREKKEAHCYKIINFFNEWVIYRKNMRQEIYLKILQEEKDKYSMSLHTTKYFYKEKKN